MRRVVIAFICIIAMMIPSNCIFAASADDAAADQAGASGQLAVQNVEGSQESGTQGAYDTESGGSGTAGKVGAANGGSYNGSAGSQWQGSDGNPAGNASENEAASDPDQQNDPEGTASEADMNTAADGDGNLEPEEPEEPTTEYRDEYVEIDGLLYYYDSEGNGTLYTGYYKKDDLLYKYEEGQGTLYSGFYKENGKLYKYTEGKGKKYTGYHKENGKLYKYKKGTGKKYTGFHKENGKLYKYKKGVGKAFTGFRKENKKLYKYTKGKKKLFTGYRIQKKKLWKYEKGKGKKYTGWLKKSKKKYYYKKGKALKNYGKVGKTWYMFSKKGVLKYKIGDYNDKVAETQTSKTRYLVTVDRDRHQVRIYKKTGHNGKTAKKWKCIKKFRCSVGKKHHRTARGETVIGKRGPSYTSGVNKLYYWTQFRGHYLFHSICYKAGTSRPTRNNIRDGRLGKDISHGCVRLALGNARWINRNIPTGTKVKVYGKTKV